MEIKVLKNEELMKFLIEKLEKQSRTNIKTLLKEGQILVNGQVQTQYNFELKSGDTVLVDWKKNRGDKVPKGIKVIFEDKDIIVVEKESGILSISTDSKKKERTVYSLLMDYVKNKDKKERIFIVHRLDKDTSGVMLFAKTEDIKNKLQENWKNLVIEREYSVVVEGVVKEKKGQIKSYLKENKAFMTYSVKDDKTGGKLAITNYTVEKIKGKYTFLKAFLETGRKNQIRVHMSDKGFPVVGDKKYGAATNPIKRLALHASTIKFTHPTTQKIMSFTSEIPKEFKRLIGE
nr:RluA family pseudouridine synthase [uncultured Cetobacterium sp.]